MEVMLIFFHRVATSHNNYPLATAHLTSKSTAQNILYLSHDILTRSIFLFLLFITHSIDSFGTLALFGNFA
jgi:hypothetical protein